MCGQSSSLHSIDVQDINADVVKIPDQNKLPRDSSGLSQNKNVKGISPTKQASIMLGSRAKSSADLKKQKKMSSLEKLRHEYEKEHIELENVRKEEEDAFASRQEARERARQIRKDAQLKMRKKTSTGQPVMKHRLEHLLEKIQRT
ncbi:hypothetical protein O6H91_07G079900 [Diphasiastrum complanatum]|nr:hypothetical protein O6H91_07G079900 [Diphasiastrum complanatum]